MHGNEPLHESIPESLVRRVGERLRRNQRIRLALPFGGRIHIDRQLPFLCVYRRPPKKEDPGTERLAASEASYLISSGQSKLQPGLTELLRGICQTLVEQFGACLLLELWAGFPDLGQASAPPRNQRYPWFRIVAPKLSGANGMADEFEEALRRVQVARRTARVSKSHATRCSPPGLPPLLPSDQAAAIGCHVLGLEIAPIWRDGRTGQPLETVLRELRRELTSALRRAFFQFASKHTTRQPPDYHALGRQAIVKTVWQVDRQLAEASDAFDFLLLVTPVNPDRAWLEFRRQRFEKPPRFQYRPLPEDPVVLKRRLYRVPVERVEDPALAQLFREKLDELDRQITMLQDRTTERFLPESIQVYGPIEDALYRLALQILVQLPARSRDESSAVQLDAAAFAVRAREEINYLRRQYSSVAATVQVRDDVSTLMVSRGSLLIGRHMRIPLARVDALLQHEIGTHVLTYYNGRAQQFRQLYTGLAGYDALQEGLAVLAEYLVGGLSRPRLRVLAARVLAARRMTEGATFVDTFRQLHREFEFPRRIAFLVAMRTYRAGGLTKDAAYLRGLVEILDYLHQGGELEPLLAGKIATRHVPIIRALQWRGILREPPLVPRYLHDAEALGRLQQLRHGVSVLDLARPKNALS